MGPLEYVAAGLGVSTSLWSSAQRLELPFGILWWSLYFFVFLEARLYSDALLQVFS